MFYIHFLRFITAMCQYLLAYDFSHQILQSWYRQLISKNNFHIILGEAMNQFLNNNAVEIIDEMKPAAIKAISTYFKTFLNSAFSKIPMDAWLTPQDFCDHSSKINDSGYVPKQFLFAHLLNTNHGFYSSQKIWTILI